MGEKARGRVGEEREHDIDERRGVLLFWPHRGWDKGLIHPIQRLNWGPSRGRAYHLESFLCQEPCFFIFHLSSSSVGLILNLTIKHLGPPRSPDSRLVNPSPNFPGAWTLTVKPVTKCHRHRYHLCRTWVVVTTQTPMFLKSWRGLQCNLTQVHIKPSKVPGHTPALAHCIILPDGCGSVAPRGRSSG